MRSNMSAKKEGLDYFPFSVDLLDDEKLDILREEYGVVANDIYIALLCLLYKKKGYYIPYETEEEKKDCVWYIYKRVRGGRYSIQQNTIPIVIESLVSQGLFSGRYFPKIITSERAQRTYYSATVERKAGSLDIKREYWMLSIEDMKKLSAKHSYYLFCTNFSKSNDLDFKSNDLTLKEKKRNESKKPPNPLQGGGSENWKEKFFERYPIFERKNYNDSEVNYEILYKEFEKSATLQKLWSFPKVIKLYQQIANGDFRDKANVNPFAELEAKAERAHWYSVRRNTAITSATKILDRFMQNEEFNRTYKRLNQLECEIGKAEAATELGDLKAKKKLIQLTQEKNRLRQQYCNLLELNGMEAEDLLPKWNCKKCSDTGYLEDGTACKCYEMVKKEE